MTSLKQTEANRLNALKSTGPKTTEGKERSRCNAIRHGLTAETVIVGFEDADDYESFEATVIADYDARSAVERELVLRLASVLWRLRRATGIETALFESAIKQAGQEISNRATADLLLSRLFLNSQDRHAEQPSTESLRKKQISQTFVRLNEMPICPMSRLNRYEHILWRQARQIITVLRSLRGGSNRPPRRGPRFMSAPGSPQLLALTLGLRRPFSLELKRPRIEPLKACHVSVCLAVMAITARRGNRYSNAGALGWGAPKASRKGDDDAKNAHGIE